MPLYTNHIVGMFVPGSLILCDAIYSQILRSQRGVTEAYPWGYGFSGRIPPPTTEAHAMTFGGGDDHRSSTDAPQHNEVTSASANMPWPNESDSASANMPQRNEGDSGPTDASQRNESTSAPTGASQNHDLGSASANIPWRNEAGSDTATVFVLPPYPRRYGTCSVDP